MTTKPSARVEAIEKYDALMVKGIKYIPYDQAVKQVIALQRELYPLTEGARAADPRGDWLAEDATADDFTAWCERRGIGVCDGGHNVENKQRDELLREAVVQLIRYKALIRQTAPADATGCSLSPDASRQMLAIESILDRARALGVGVK